MKHECTDQDLICEEDERERIRNIRTKMCSHRLIRLMDLVRTDMYKVMSGEYDFIEVNNPGNQRNTYTPIDMTLSDRLDNRITQLTRTAMGAKYVKTYGTQINGWGSICLNDAEAKEFGDVSAVHSFIGVTDDFLWETKDHKDEQFQKKKCGIKCGNIVTDNVK